LQPKAVLHSKRSATGRGRAKKSRAERKQADGQDGHEMTTPGLGEQDEAEHRRTRRARRRRINRRPRRRLGTNAASSQATAGAVQLAVGLAIVAGIVAVKLTSGTASAASESPAPQGVVSQVTTLSFRTAGYRSAELTLRTTTVVTALGDHVLAQPVKALPVGSYSDFAGKAEAGRALWRS
jgi:hypothetical protein